MSRTLPHQDRFEIAKTVFPLFLQLSATVNYNRTLTDLEFNAESRAYGAALEAFTAADAFLAAEAATTHFNTTTPTTDE